MIPQTDTIESSDTSNSYVASSRQSSITYIPRPISGTSRRASSILNIPAEPQTSASSRIGRSLSPHQDFHLSRPERSSCRPNHGMPPTSFLLPKSVPIQSDVPLPGVQPERKISRLIGEFNARQSSVGQLNMFNKPAIISSTVQRSPQRQNSCMSREKQAAKAEPSPRTLAKGIPKSQTTGSLACLTGVSDISPAKPPRKSSLGHALHDKPDTVDNLLEHRKMEHEVRVSQHVHNEAITSHREAHPKEYVLSVRPNGSVPPLHDAARSIQNDSSSITLNLSINDEVNAQRLEDHRRKSKTRRPLFINTTLANTTKTHASSPLSCSSPQSYTTAPTLSSESTPNPRHVYHTQNTAFWTGRYMSTSDHLRKVDCDSLLKAGPDGKAPLGTSSHQFEQEFDRLDASRSDRALAILQQTCMTETAEKSLSRFEAMLKKKLTKPHMSFVRSYSEMFMKHNKEGQAKSMMNEETVGIRDYAVNGTTNQLSTFNAQATIEKLSGLVNRRPELPKSKTTPNLTLKSVSERVPTPGKLRTSGRFLGGLRPSQVQTPFKDLPVSETRARAIQERETRPQNVMKLSGDVNKEIILSDQYWRPEANGIRSLSGLHSGQWPLCPRLPPARLDYDTPDTLPASYPTVMALETDLGLPSAPGLNACDIPDANDESAIKETVLYRKKRRDGHSSGQRSGEFVKKVVGASIREVRKMSRRVGSMGWGGSSEDLSNDAMLKTA